MAYAVPPEWDHGDVPTAALMQRYSDALNAIKAILDITPKNMAAPVYVGDPDDAEWTIVHINRYLKYEAESQLFNPDDLTQTVTLPDTDEEQGVYDLDSIGWLLYGQTYRVSGCAWAFEDWEP